MNLSLSVLVERYKDDLYRAAFFICKNQQDAEDAVQEAFIAYHASKKEFLSEEHTKAWLYRVAINKAKDMAASAWRRKTVPLEEYMETLDFTEEDDKSVFRSVLALPEKYRIVIYLFYYEGYKVDEIARILKSGPGTIKSRLSRARGILREKLKEGWNDDE